jgi:hypothetical protein
VTVRRALPLLLAFALGLGAAGLTACGSSGGSSKALIGADDADGLKSDFDAVASAVADGNCPKASQALLRAGTDIDQLPARVSKRLQRRLADGLDTLREQARQECAANLTQTSTTETVTQPVTTATTETATTPPPTTTTPPETTTTPPVDTTATPPADTTTIDPEATGGAGTP